METKFLQTILDLLAGTFGIAAGQPRSQDFSLGDLTRPCQIAKGKALGTRLAAGVINFSYIFQT